MICEAPYHLTVVGRFFVLILNVYVLIGSLHRRDNHIKMEGRK